LILAKVVVERGLIFEEGAEERGLILEEVVVEERGLILAKVAVLE